jgi:hypothetical protein
MASVSRQGSDTELAGQVAASLTPRLNHLPIQRRGEQNSGLIDIGAIYAASVEQVMRRAQKAKPAALTIADTLGHPIANVAPQRTQVPRVAEPVEEYEDVDLAAEYVVIPGIVPRGRIGWFATAVSWLATATLAAGVATMVPAHRVKGELVPAKVAAAAPATAPPAAAPVPASAPAATTTATGTTDVTALPVAPREVPAAAAPAPVVVAPKSHLVAPLPARSRPAARAAVADTAPNPVVAPAAKKPAVVADSAPPAVKAAAPKVVPAAAPAAAAPASGGSLEDLIRQAVAAESAKKHTTAGPGASP